jgi:putative nucleotidyltransferase with HDIG domain
MSNSISEYKSVPVQKLREFVLHSICVSKIAGLVSRELELPESFQEEIELAGLFHDIGKIMSDEFTRSENDGKSEGIYVDTLRNTRTHPSMGYMVLQEKGYSNFIANAVLYHHENYDGTGFPSNLTGKEIPIAARILRICDTYAALISNRPYRKAFDSDTAMELMREDVKNFDMKVFLAFMAVMQEEQNQIEIQTICHTDRPLEEVAGKWNEELKEIEVLWQNQCKD